LGFKYSGFRLSEKVEPQYANQPQNIINRELLNGSHQGVEEFAHGSSFIFTQRFFDL
jgi:hypothetical protein